MEPKIEPSIFDKIIHSSFSLIVSSIIAILIGIYIEKFKSRLSILKYKIFFHPLATTTLNDFWGNIQALYNNRPTNHLNFITLEIFNESNNDFQDVDIDVWVDVNSQILGQSGNYKDTGNAILLEADHNIKISEIFEISNKEEIKKQGDPSYVIPVSIQNNVRWALSNQKFNLPVFNRRSAVTLNLLVENFKGQQPEIVVSILHKSIKLLKQEEQDKYLKKLLIQVIIWGLLIFIIGFIILMDEYPTAKIPIIYTGILGLTYTLFGLIISKVVTFVRRFLS